MGQHKKISQKKQTASGQLIRKTWWLDEKLHYFLLLAGAFILYGWTVTFDYNLDDDYIVSLLSEIDNSATGAISIFKIWFGSSDYRPVSIFSFWLERWFAGSLQPATSHLVNVMIYAGILVALYRFILTCQFYENNDQLKMLALLCCMTFLVHPNHVSVVANIKSRDNLLSMFFGILAAIQLIKTFDRRTYYRLLLFFLWILLSLLSKRDSYSFIVIPALVIVFFRQVNIRKIMAALLSVIMLYFFVFIAYGLFKSLPDPDLYDFTMRISENPLAGAHSYSDSISMALTSLYYYFKFLIWPDGYYFYFGYNQIPLTGLFSIYHILVILAGLIMLALSAWKYKTNKIYLFCLLAFAASIAYALNLYTPVAGIVMDRYNFIPSIYFCLGLSALFTQIDQRNQFFRISGLTLLFLCMVFAGFTVYRTSAWKNYHSLFERDLPFLKKSVNAYRLAGGTYIHLALQEELKKDHNKSMADSFIQKGEGYIMHALKIYDQSPQAWELAGLCDYYRRNDSTALAKFQKSFQADTNFLSSANYIGAAYWNLNQIDSAYYYFSYVMNREPIFNYSANNLINLLMRYNRQAEADSIIHILQNRFPEDKRLKKKITELYPVTNPLKN